MAMSDQDAKTFHVHAGQRFYCQHCKSDSVVQVIHDIQGFRIVSEKVICAFCKEEIDGAVLEPVEQSSVGAVASAPPEATNSASALSSLLQLDTEKKVDKEALSAMLSGSAGEDSDSPKHFCRDCDYYLHHPFLSRCSLHNRTVEPMDDCPSFRAKKRKRDGTGA